ncbi:MAG: hypothetical protein H6Q15_1457 [Bacteroidetes bacterium]|nr:hypothetical protein [Bacteroidota bacterium]
MKVNVYSFVLGIVISLCSLSVNAQEYQYIPIVKPGLQIWTTFFGSESTSGNHYNRFALTDEDTLIENETYKKLYWFQDSVFNSSTAECIGGLRENSQKQVFYKGKQGYNFEYWPNGMLYDFSLSVGDTFSSYQMSYKHIVRSIDTININGIQRRIFNIGAVYLDIDTTIIETGNWIEGIGNDQGLLYNMYDRLVSGGSSGYTRCYEYNGELQYHDSARDSLHGFVGCSSSVGLSTIEKDKANIFAYPNPAKEDINFSCSFMIKDIEIYDIMGRRVYQKEVKDYSKSIDISSFNKGIYIAKLNTEQGLVSKKFIVE